MPSDTSEPWRSEQQDDDPTGGGAEADRAEALARALRRAYAEVAAEPLPEAFETLLQRLR